MKIINFRFMRLCYRVFVMKLLGSRPMPILVTRARVSNQSVMSVYMIAIMVLCNLITKECVH